MQLHHLLVVIVVNDVSDVKGHCRCNICYYVVNNYNIGTEPRFF